MFFIEKYEILNLKMEVLIVKMNYISINLWTKTHPLEYSCKLYYAPIKVE